MAVSPVRFLCRRKGCTADPRSCWICHRRTSFATGRSSRSHNARRLSRPMRQTWRSSGKGLRWFPVTSPLSRGETFFDRFAGIFLAFGCLERAVRASLTKGGSRRDAEYRLFGEKYDSLGNLLNRVVKEAAEDKGDLVEQYVMALCAKQLERELRREYPEFWGEYSSDVKKLRERIDVALSVRQRLVARDPKEMPAFLKWFDDWFLRRATPVVAEAP